MNQIITITEYHLAYLKKRLPFYESLTGNQVTPEILREAKVWHKYWKDIENEGSTDGDEGRIFKTIQTLNTIERLEAFIKKHGSTPFKTEVRVLGYEWGGVYLNLIIT